MIPLRVILDSAAVGGFALYHLSRHNQFGRVRALSISFDMVFGVAWRSVVALLVSDQISKRLCVNGIALRKH